MTVEERANAALESYGWNVYYHYSVLTEDSFKRGYIQGAMEQKAIDDNLLREAIKMLIDNDCELLNKELREVDYGKCDEAIDAFVKRWRKNIRI